jgi:hypothetical protein
LGKGPAELIFDNPFDFAPLAQGDVLPPAVSPPRKAQDGGGDALRQRGGEEEGGAGPVAVGIGLGAGEAEDVLRAPGDAFELGIVPVGGNDRLAQPAAFANFLGGGEDAAEGEDFSRLEPPIAMNLPQMAGEADELGKRDGSKVEVSELVPDKSFVDAAAPVVGPGGEIEKLEVSRDRGLIFAGKVLRRDLVFAGRDDNVVLFEQLRKGETGVDEDLVAGRFVRDGGVFDPLVLGPDPEGPDLREGIAWVHGEEALRKCPQRAGGWSWPIITNRDPEGLLLVTSYIPV